MMRSIGRHAAALLTLVLVVGVSAALAQSPMGDSEPQDTGTLERAEVVNELLLPHAADITPTLRSPPPQGDVEGKSDSRTNESRDDKWGHSPLEPPSAE
jgi:hypothetical protein